MGLIVTPFQGFLSLDAITQDFALCYFMLPFQGCFKKRNLQSENLNIVPKRQIDQCKRIEMKKL